VYQADFWNTGAPRELFYDGFGQLHGTERLGGVLLWNANGTLKKTYGASAATAALGGALIPASAPYCQNEILESGEQCDDGNFTPCDGCTATCHTEFGCGDGSKCGAEACDDGNLTSCDGCSSACVAETCGDSVICAGLGETCDDGNTAPCDGCSPACKTEQCGNAIIDCNEQCDDGNPASCDGCTSCQLDELAYLDQFESGTNGWSETGLWNQDIARSVSPSHAWYYGNPVLHNYETFFPPENSGTLTSPVIDLSGVSGTALKFSYFLETQNQAGLDVASVEVSRDGFLSDITTLESQLPDAGAFTKKNHDLSAFDGDQIQVRFGFDTVDGNQNTFEGFYVDDVAVQGMGAPVCGNGMAAHLCSEACDDGNTVGGDGCSAACQAEGVTDQGFFSGTGQGGSIAITVNGVALNVTTTAGDSAATVASRVSGAINGNGTLQGLGVTATWDGARLDVIAGAIGALTSNDPGIQATHGAGSVPTLSGLGAAFLVFLLVLSAARQVRRRA
jgi:cysteine-rich repeat protein